MFSKENIVNSVILCENLTQFETLFNTLRNNGIAHSFTKQYQNYSDLYKTLFLDSSYDTTDPIWFMIVWYDGYKIDINEGYWYFFRNNKEYHQHNDWDKYKVISYYDIIAYTRNKKLERILK